MPGKNCIIKTKKQQVPHRKRKSSGLGQKCFIITGPSVVL